MSITVKGTVTTKQNNAVITPRDNAIQAEAADKTQINITHRLAIAPQRRRSTAIFPEGLPSANPWNTFGQLD
jgi:hypothetical protein